MNENNSRIVEYVLVILIGLIVSYVIFAQQQASKDKFSKLEDRLTIVEQDINSLRSENVIEGLKIKALDEKVNPKVEVTAPTEEGKTTNEGATTAPTTPQPKTVPTVK
jgi:hypothetical protein